MSTEPVLGPALPASKPTAPRLSIRIEYVDCQTLPEYREYRLAAYGPDGPVESRFRIAIAAFGAGRVRIQDGPDVCYQKLLRSVAAGETASPDVVVIDDIELASYRTAHTPAPKHRSWTPSPDASAAAKPPYVAQMPPRPRSPEPLVAPPPPTDHAQRGLGEGQRVSHSVFGVGVTAGTSGGRTTICFDQDGPKTFVTSMLELEVLSAPHTWETTPRGKNRPRTG
ncbi:MAG TPA: hypothetical protein VFT38_15995 [Vicinamibacteria bacterium]|nr:hypothetical protein [Vicinamibacteria bacterium]